MEKIRIFRASCRTKEIPLLFLLSLFSGIFCHPLHFGNSGDSNTREFHETQIVNCLLRDAFCLGGNRANGSASTLSYTGSPYTFTRNLPVATITPIATGTVNDCSSSPSLPSGLQLNATTCAISGIPTITQAATSYTITTKNGHSTTISIIVNPKTIPASIRTGLYAWYPLDGNADDMSGNAHHGYSPGGIWPATLGPSYASGRSNVPNDVASFNGSNQFFASDFNPLCHQDFSIALWVYPLTVVDNKILGTQGWPSGNPGVQLVINSTGNFNFGAFWAASGGNVDGILTSSSVVLLANQWTHVAYVHNGSTRNGNVWVNGVSAGATSNFGSFAGCTTGTGSNQWWTGPPMNVGYSYAGAFFTGRMDDLWFFQGRQLSAADISTLMSLP